jgi:hypothetical protein
MTKSPQAAGWEHELTTGRSWTLRSRRPVPTPAQRALAAAKARRAPPNPADKTLSPDVPRWLASLPTDARPSFLCANFPRIVNRIAACWPDPALAVGMLDQFFIDKRGGRRGFPLQAVCELTGLRKLAIRRMNHPRRGPA